MYSKVPGRQTVCRAEAWALHNVIDAWPGNYALEIIVDATYSLSGMDLIKRSKHLKGANADIWISLYAILEHKKLYPLTIKVKSHANSVEAHTFGHTIAMLALNELADAAAGIFTDHQGAWLTTLAAQVVADKLNSTSGRPSR